MAVKKNYQIPEIIETEDEKKYFVKELKKIYFDWALHNIRGKSFFNKSINKSISVSRYGLGEWKTNTKSKEQALSIKILDQLLENAVFWKNKIHNPLDSNIIEVLYFKQDCKINFNMYTAIMTVKVYKAHNHHKYYHHYLDDFTLTSVQ
ncbi:MAG: hypothetical protein FWD40_00040 [Treponema sp.]|nr:hypothetical protein [Treponema sp.]